MVDIQSSERQAGHPSAPTRVRLFNVKFSPNLGDGLLSESLENALIEEGCDGQQTYSVDMAARSSYGPGTESRLLLLKALHRMPSKLRQAAVRVPLELMMRRRWRPHYVAHLGGAQAVVIGGGNLFTDMDLNFPSKMSAVLSLAAEYGLPAAIYGVGVTGDWSRTGLSMMRKVLTKTRPCYVSVRDMSSKQHFDELFADAAGLRAELVRDPGLLVSRYVAPPDPRTDERAIGLCVTSATAVEYHSHIAVTGAELANWYIALCKELSGEGRPVIAFTNGSPEDELFLDGIADQLRASAGTGYFRRQVSTPTELATLIADFEVLIAHRMHALIAGYSFGVPIFALQWDKKVDAFMESIGAADRIAPAVPATVQKVTTAVRGLLASPPNEEERRRQILNEAMSGVTGLARALEHAIDLRSAAICLTNDLQAVPTHPTAIRPVQHITPPST